MYFFAIFVVYLHMNSIVFKCSELAARVQVHVSTRWELNIVALYQTSYVVLSRVKKSSQLLKEKATVECWSMVLFIAGYNSELVKNYFECKKYHLYGIKRLLRTKNNFTIKPT